MKKVVLSASPAVFPSVDYMSKRFGVIDIGTLKVKFQIVEVSHTGQMHTVHQSNTLTLLGAHMNENNNRPKPENLKLTLDELRKCKVYLDQHNIDKLRVVSTHALREMGKVGKEIAGLIKQQVGLSVEIISQQEEAELFYNAVLRDFKTNDDFTIVDVGGGSVQILIGNKDKLKKSFLLKTGTSTLWDKFTPKHGALDYPSREEIRKMTSYVLKEIQPVPRNLRTPIIYGSSCIIDLFHGLHLRLNSYPYSKSHPYKLPIAPIDDFLSHVWSIPYDVREEKFVSPTTKYMWGIDKALLNVTSLAHHVSAPYLIPSNANINQGLLLSMQHLSPSKTTWEQFPTPEV